MSELPFAAARCAACAVVVLTFLCIAVPSSAKDIDASRMVEAAAELDGEQYVAALAGLGGVAMAGGLVGSARPRSEFGRVVAFKLGGKAQLPPVHARTARAIPDLRRANASGDRALGQRHYDRVCAVCHGANARSATSVPDLRFSNAIGDRAEFKAIVIDGARADKGMVGFVSLFSEADAEAIRAYLVFAALQSAEAH